LKKDDSVESEPELTPEEKAEAEAEAERYKNRDRAEKYKAQVSSLNLPPQFHLSSIQDPLSSLEPQLLAEKQLRRNETRLKRNYGGMFEAEAEESDDEDGLQMGVFDCSSGIQLRLPRPLSS
jgi:hypothetical protein